MKRSKFSLSNYKLLSCDMGELVPINCMEVLAGDTIQQATSALVRVSPLLAPVMHPVHVRIHHWFVPHRLIWQDWEDFITGGPDGMNASDPPYVTGAAAEVEVGSLADYMGVPPNAYTVAPTFSMLPFRAYALIWNEWYRDQDLQPELPILRTSGADGTTPMVLQHCGWEKDYFTSSRPWTQKGPEVTIPFGGMADVIGKGNLEPMFKFGAATINQQLFAAQANNSPIFGNQPSEAGPLKWEDPKLQTDLSTATAVKINDLREAFAIQRYEEARARYGSRYTEYLRYLGVRSSDARLQRPEYLGGGRQTIQFSEVLQTGPDTDDSGVANLKGHGIGALRSNRYRRFFEEHGYVISLMSVKPKTMYAQGLPRHFNRRTKEDYFQKELQHIGQQEVLRKEIYVGSIDPDGTFGYQDRYDEYRRQESSVAGDFRSTLDHWHYARIFASEPALNADFIKSVPTKRVNAVESEDVLWVMANHSIQARRMVASKGTSFIL